MLTISVNIDYYGSSVGRLAIGILNGCETVAVSYGIRSADRRSWAGRSRRHLPNPNAGDTIVGSACPLPIRGRFPRQWRRCDYPASQASMADSLGRQRLNHFCLVRPIARPATCGNRQVDLNGIRCGRPAGTARETARGTDIQRSRRSRRAQHRRAKAGRPGFADC